MPTLSDEKFMYLRFEYGLSRPQMNDLTNRVIEENEEALANSKDRDNLLYDLVVGELSGSTKESSTSNSTETTREADENSNRKELDVYMVTHKDVMDMYDEASYKTYVSSKAISNFEGTTIEEWNNYIRKRGAKQAIVDFMESAKEEFNGKISAPRTIERHISKLINNDIPLVKVENHNGKVYYKLLNCIDGKYYVRIPYEKVRELVVSTSSNALKICAVMTYLCDEKTSKMEKVYKNGKVYFTISRKCVAEAIGLSGNSGKGLGDIGMTLTSLCNLGFLECLETVETSKDGNTYKTIHSYRITTIEEYRQAKKRGFVSEK